MAYLFFLALFAAILAVVCLRPAPPRYAPKKPFTVRQGYWSGPSAHLRAIAAQRRAERLANPTAAEKRFAAMLAAMGLREGIDYEREWIFYYPKSFGLADFYFPTQRIILEIDGKTHDESSQRRHDIVRDAYCREKGLRVVRIPNLLVMRQPHLARALVLAELR